MSGALVLLRQKCSALIGRRIRHVSGVQVPVCAAAGPARGPDQLQGRGEEDPGRDPGEGGLRQQDPTLGQ